jgi:drug/metabolite transporter (DMT)-like permease
MDRGYALTLINGIAMLIGGCLSMVTALLFEDVRHAVTAWVPFLGWVLALVVVANIVVYNLYGWLLRRYSITFLSFAGFLSPSFGMVYAWLLEGQHLTWHYPVSLCLVTAGLYIFYRQELKKQGISS